MNVKSITLKDWVICGECGCKLFKILANPLAKHIEIKCHQCKTINSVDIGVKNEQK